MRPHQHGVRKQTQREMVMRKESEKDLDSSLWKRRIRIPNRAEQSDATLD